MKIIRTSYDIPEELHTKFKSTCATLKVDMKDIIRVLINKWLITQQLITQQNKEVDKLWKKQSSKN